MPNRIFPILVQVIQKHLFLSIGIVITVIGAVVSSLLPPLVLETVINALTLNEEVSFLVMASYFGLLALTHILDSSRESLLVAFGQKMTHAIRSALCQKMSKLPVNTFVKQETGTTVSRFVNDVDMIESLFTSGIISMFADVCKLISIVVILFIKNRGLTIILLFVVPIIVIFTRFVQKKMLTAQINNRIAVGKVTNHVPETIRCIRTIHLLHGEAYMQKVYNQHIQDSYEAIEKNNFYDAIYSPIILILNAIVIAVVMLFSATGNQEIQTFFGMSVGTAVAVINYISSIFAPIESIGMEIQTIQSAIAGVKRIDEFLSLEERHETKQINFQQMLNSNQPCIELKNVTFGYDPNITILNNLSFQIQTGEQVTLIGRTGAGKSTIFKLLLGLYQANKGEINIYGKDASKIPDSEKRKIFGYVEQSFKMVPGTVKDQITLFDESITNEMITQASKTVGLHDMIQRLPQGYDTPCTSSIFSQGQWQLLSIARAIVSQPKILLLDEITANLDAETEQTVLQALQNASKNRTVISISHRLYQQTGGRTITIHSES